MLLMCNTAELCDMLHVPEEPLYPHDSFSSGGYHSVHTGMLCPD